MRAAAQNAALNAMEGRFQALQCMASTEGPEPLAAAACGPAPVSGAFDVVMANILQVLVPLVMDRLILHIPDSSCRSTPVTNQGTLR